MRNHFLILALCCAAAFVGCGKEEDINSPDGGKNMNVEIPEDMEEAFPDPIFRDYVLWYFDTDENGKISKAEALAVTQINVDNSYTNSDYESKCIKSLKGIQYFTNLKYLSCYANKLTTLDVSKNTQLILLHCNFNQLTSLDVSKNTRLTDLECAVNQLKKLDVSKNTQLTMLNCNANQLTSLDVRKNTKLIYLYCDNNRLTALDVSKNTELTRLHCPNNQLTTLDVSKTNLGNSTEYYPLDCAPMSTLKTLYLKKGWSIQSITEDNGRSTEYIPAQTQIVFVD